MSIIAETVTRPPLHEQLRLHRSSKASDQRWGVYNSSIDRYDGYFVDILEGKSTVDLLKDKPNPVVIDLMAPTGTLRSLFSRLPNEAKGFGIAVGIDDLRTDVQKEEDQALGIHYIKGDLTKSQTWKKIEEVLNGRKADLIMCRPIGGISCLPDHAGFFAVAAQRIWNMLSDNGQALLQKPDDDNLLFRGKWASIDEWIAVLNNAGIVSRNSHNSISLTRISGSPAQLPFPREILLQEPDDPITMILTNPNTYSTFFSPQTLKNIPWTGQDFTNESKKDYSRNLSQNIEKRKLYKAEQNISLPEEELHLKQSYEKRSSSSLLSRARA